MNAIWWVLLGTIGPIGAIGVVRAMSKSYGEWKTNKGPRLAMASQDVIFRHEQTLMELIPVLFGFSYYDCLLTDESSLEDFEPDHPREQSIRRVEERYGVRGDALPNTRLVTICEAIELRRT